MPSGKKTSSGTLEKLLPVLLVVTILLAFAVGALWQKVSFLGSGTGGGSGSGSAGNVANNPPPDGAPPEAPPSGKLDEAQAAKVVAVSKDDHIQGSTNAKVILVEYSDYECPYCQSFHPTAQQAVDEYGDDVAWVYRHYPLEFIHSNAKPAAEAAECVADLAGNDAFWEYSEKLFEGSPASLNNLEDLAVEVGVNSNDFNSCVESGKFADKVQEQLDGGSEAGITGTPGTFIISKSGDVWLVPGALPIESLKATIDEALQS